MKALRRVVSPKLPATRPARHRRAFRLLTGASLLAALAIAVPASASVCYVNGAAAGANDGSSWGNAYVSPQGALGNNACTEIWIASGTYYPTATTDRSVSFVIKPGVAVYGGFAGNEVARGQRDAGANATILSGNIGDTNNPFDNTYHVVIIDGTTAAGPVGNDTVLDGFTVTAGDAIGSTGPGIGAAQGAGIYCNGFSATNTSTGHACSPTLSNLMITNNDGNGLFNDAYEGVASPVVTNVTFRGNSGDGAGMASYAYGNGASARPLLTNVTFVQNTGSSGGAINNSAAGGGKARVAVINGTFSGNNANKGAAIYNNSYNATAASGTQAYSYVSNSILWDASASNEIFNVWDGTAADDTATSILLNVDVRNGCPAHSSACSGINADPLLGALADNGGATLTMLPAANSPVINTGIDSGCWKPDGTTGACPASDQRGVGRPQGAHPDMGAVEIEALCYVDQAAAGSNDGTSWADAYTDLQSALAGGKCAEVWIAAGTYRPTAGGDRTIAFDVAPGVVVRGGFAGNETSLAQRHPLLSKPTTLSGDIGATDDVTDNSYHVVVIDGTTAAGPVDGDTVLDSLVITGGNANAATPNDRGAGVYCIGDGARCSPTLTNLYFLGVANTQTVYGGALFNSGIGGTSSPTILDTTFAGNSATQRGGAMYNDGSGGGDSSPVITNVTFGGNQSPSGGAIFNDGYNGTSSPVVTNATFNQNAATNGAAMYDVTTGGKARPVIVNSVLWFDGVPEIVSEGCPQFPADNSNCVPSIAYSDVAYAFVGFPPWFSNAGGVFDVNPGFAQLADNGGFAPTYIPPPTYPSVIMDAGNDATCAATDERGVIRPRNAHCDMGAAEIAYSRIFADGFDGAVVP